MKSYLDLTQNRKRNRAALALLALAVVALAFVCLFVAKTVYPALFEDIDMTAKTDEITQAFFGMELADQIAAAPSSFGGYQRIDTASFFA